MSNTKANASNSPANAPEVTAPTPEIIELTEELQIPLVAFVKPFAKSYSSIIKEANRPRDGEVFSKDVKVYWGNLQDYLLSAVDNSIERYNSLLTEIIAEVNKKEVKKETVFTIGSKWVLAGNPVEVVYMTDTDLCLQDLHPNGTRKQTLRKWAKTSMSNQKPTIFAPTLAEAPTTDTK